MVPTGWSAPSTTTTAAGDTTASTGAVTIATRTITVTGVTLGAGGTLTLTYGSTAGGGPGATVTPTTGAATWTAQESSVLTGTLTTLASSPSTTVYAANGTGTLTLAPPITFSASSTANTLTFTYTAAAGGINNGEVTVAVPTGWGAPTLTTTAANYTTASIGTVAVSGQTITVSGVTLAANGTLTLTYGSTAGGGPGATAPPTTGAVTWTAEEASVLTGTLATLGVSPTTTIYAADGTGTLTLATPTTFAASSTANTLTFTYTAVTGGISNGAVSFAVPTGWSAPSTHDHRRRLHHRLDRRGRRQWTDHHRVGRHPGRRRHAHRHLRQQGERRTRRDRSPHDGRGDLDGPGDVDRHRHTHRARDLALDHRLRGQRHGDAHARVPDHLRGVLHRQHPHLHLHRRRRRHQQR